ncbi:hypothetical protein NE857_32630 [Nocardiopsis exhalans]|uniref:Uncharacterized protein n=1 Tax=Nocardiopsis exhalans TaxID=163604 RepID=A0ABY5DA34_9ACTN|nr:hypothetical protein [Nocardiopsis exhalans]USY19918.1 hypothetical protein NE857_32630 [Nocardiopsis exhalans]
MTGPHQVSSGVRQRLSAPRGHCFPRPGANRPLAAPPQPRQHRHSSGPYFSTPETHSDRQARLLRQMEGNPRVAHMLRHGPTPHWFEVDRQRREQEEREARRLEEAFAALTDAPATPTRGRHRAPRPWWGWPALAISTTLLLAQTTAEALGRALFQTGLPPL